MSIATNYIACPPGIWVQVCEKRQHRKTLKIQLLGGILVLATATNGPWQYTEFGGMPAGLWHSLDNGNGPATFTLSRFIDDDLVEQAWYAWIVPGTTPDPATIPPATVTITESTTWTVPGGISTLTIDCIGAGGAANDAIQATGAATGGGGGGAWAESTLPVTQGQNCTLSIGQGGAAGGVTTPTETWFSLTASKPTLDTEGVLAAPGENWSGPDPWDGGAGGQDTDCIGQNKASGGNGGMGADFPQTGPGLGGGGGGGAAIGGGLDGGGGGDNGGGGSGGLSGGGNGGNDNIAHDTPIWNGAQGTFGGGGGGGTWNSGGPFGRGGAGGNGVITLTWQPPLTYVPFVIVMESFATPHLDDPDWVDPSKQIQVDLPRLSRKGVEALKDLLARIEPQEDQNNALQDEPEHDNPDSGDGGAGDIGT